MQAQVKGLIEILSPVCTWGFSSMIYENPLNGKTILYDFGSDWTHELPEPVRC